MSLACPVATRGRRIQTAKTAVIATADMARMIHNSTWGVYTLIIRETWICFGLKESHLGELCQCKFGDRLVMGTL